MKSSLNGVEVWWPQTPDLAQWWGRPSQAMQLPRVALPYILDLSSTRCYLQLLMEGPVFGQLCNLRAVSSRKEGNMREFLVSLLRVFWVFVCLFVFPCEKWRLTGQKYPFDWCWGGEANFLLPIIGKQAKLVKVNNQKQFGRERDHNRH